MAEERLPVQRLDEALWAFGEEMTFGVAKTQSGERVFHVELAFANFNSCELPVEMQAYPPKGAKPWIAKITGLDTYTVATSRESRVGLQREFLRSRVGYFYFAPTTGDYLQISFLTQMMGMPFVTRVEVLVTGETEDTVTFRRISEEDIKTHFRGKRYEASLEGFDLEEMSLATQIGAMTAEKRRAFLRAVVEMYYPEGFAALLQ